MNPPDVAGDEAPSQTAFDEIDGRLMALGASEGARRLWIEVRAAFEDGGPAAVKTLVASQARDLARVAEKDLKETRSVARATAPQRKKKPAKARGRKA